MPLETSTEQPTTRPQGPLRVPREPLNSPYSQTQTEIARNRATLISYLVKLTKCVDADHADLAQAICQRFNELLVDYLSFGHFRFLESFQPEPHQLAAINHFTELALNFAENYSATDQVPMYQLKRDLDSLAFTLEVRFEIEDELLYAQIAGPGLI